jgi:aryl-alcohol dehydrogenase-like predicted oxidoreductase
MGDMALPQNSLGRTGLVVTKLGYGAMEVRGSRIWGGRPIEDATAEQILNAVVDNGITFIDTANDYGRSEEYIGRFLSHRRAEFVLATKCGCTVMRRDETPTTLRTCGIRRTCSAGCTRAWLGCEPTTSM